jgi:uncharacterized protein
MNVADELQKLQQLHQSGTLSDEEFAKAKADLLNPPPSGLGSVFGSATTEQKARQWAMFLHLSQLANFLVPLAGLITPIVIWQIKKAEMPELDAHGKIVANWIISAFLYAIGCVILAFLLVGFLLIPILAALMIIFPIIGGVKANGGEAWKYPLSIPFFK